MSCAHRAFFAKGTSVGLFDFLKGKTAEAARPSAPASPPAGEPHDLGCLVCGKALLRGEASRPLACALCGERRPATVRCPDGHFVCDACERADAKDVIEKVCAATTERDPVALAVRLMQLPALKVHGAEHRFLVPAVLLATWSNATGAGARRAERVAEARRRAEADPGAACDGSRGCGAVDGAGTFVAIATAAAPTDGATAALADTMMARARAVVGEAGSRCCKRDSLLSILAAARFAREHLDVDLPARGIGCDWTGRGADCMGSGCPFNR
jgi:hypothetical protein